jgi:hypothetical protein
MPSRICTICEEREVSPRSRFTTCPVCRGNMGGWVRKGVAAILSYRRKLQIRETRMEYLVEDDTRDFTQRQRERISSQPMGAKPVVLNFPTPSQVKKNGTRRA